jgi:hypothetical protein
MLTFHAVVRIATWWGGIGPPEDYIMTNTTLSRRRLLASSMPALATAAAMAPVAATALCRLPAGADAELLALGRELAPLVAEVNAARAIDRKGQDAFEAKLAALGLKDEKEYADVDAYNEERWRLCDESRELQRALDVDDDDGGHRSWEDLHNDLFALMDDILDIRPTTVQGLAVQVLAIVTAFDDICLDDPPENEALPYGVAAFLRNICSFVGVPLPEAAA